MAEGRRRGGQPGNTNRLRHGRWSKAGRERDAEAAPLLRKTEHLVLRAVLVGRARRIWERRTSQPLPFRQYRDFDDPGLLAPDPPVACGAPVCQLAPDGGAPQRGPPLERH